MLAAPFEICHFLIWTNRNVIVAFNSLLHVVLNKEHLSLNKIVRYSQETKLTGLVGLSVCSKDRKSYKIEGFRAAL